MIMERAFKEEVACMALVSVGQSLARLLLTLFTISSTL